MKQTQPNIDIYSTTKNIEKPKLSIIPQSTKYSAHSKIKGFSFHADNTKEENISFFDGNKKDSKDNKDNKDERDFNENNHKHKIKQSCPSGFLQKPSINNEQVLPNITSTSKDKEKTEQNKQNGIDTPLNITDLIKEQNNTPLSKSFLKSSYEKYENTRFSSKSLNLIKSFAANTHQGVVRKYNEDRVSIILNIIKPNSFKGSYWPTCSFFGIFDGHGGNKCADYLKDNLHNFIIKSPYFPKNPQKAITEGFNQCDDEYITNHALGPNNIIMDRSGSCAIVILLIDKKIYVANTGDSRGIMSVNDSITVLSNDHKPNNDNEKKRILEEGGKIYQTQTQAKNFNIKLDGIDPEQVLLGPYRVFPGRLSVSRSFGDVEAKLPMYNGNPNILISTPEVKIFEINSNIEWIILGCDGIYDNLSNEEIKTCIDFCFENDLLTKDIHSQTGISVDLILKTSLKRKSMDNITCVMLTFEGFERKFQLNKEKSSETRLQKTENQVKDVLKEEKDVKTKQIIANGMTKKGLSINKNMSTSISSTISSQVMKESGSQSNIGSISQNKSHSKNKTSQNSVIIEKDSIYLMKNKLKEEKDFGFGGSFPSTVKNSKAQNVIFKK